MKTCELCHLIVDLCGNTAIFEVDYNYSYQRRIGYIHKECLEEAERMLNGKSRAVSNSSADSTRAVATIPHGN